MRRLLTVRGRKIVVQAIFKTDSNVLFGANQDSSSVRQNLNRAAVR